MLNLCSKMVVNRGPEAVKTSKNRLRRHGGGEEVSRRSNAENNEEVVTSEETGTYTPEMWKDPAHNEQ